MWPESVPSSLSFTLLCTLTPFSPLGRPGTQPELMCGCAVNPGATPSLLLNSAVLRLMVREGFQKGLEGSWTLSLEKVCAKAQRHENYLGVWESWLACVLQGWGAEKWAGHKGQLRQALGDLQTLPHCSQTVPIPGIPPLACFFTNQPFEGPAPERGSDRARRKS